jgi:hypothetical protein
MKEKLGIVTQPREAFLVCFMTKFEQHFPLYWRESAKKQQAIACWKCCKTHKNVKENLCFYIEIFCIKNQQIIYLK